METTHNTLERLVSEVELLAALQSFLWRKMDFRRGRINARRS